MHDLKLHAIIQSVGAMIIPTSKNKHVSVSNTKYTKHSTKFSFNRYHRFFLNF